MEIIRTIAAMQAWSNRIHRSGETVAFVPTMGFLHAGHAALMREAKKRGNRVVVSIFVNPTQFGPNEDLDKYPRDFEGDSRLCEREGVDAIFFPEAAEMYPPGAQTWVEVQELSRDHCGASRPGHFRGVATIVTKLFLAVKPDTAVFGEKDFQQLAVIRRMARDLNFDTEIVGLATVREPDNLAMSSRNKYLSPDERKRALCIPKGIRAAQAKFAAGERDARILIDSVRRELDAAGAEPDYVHLVDPDTLGNADRAESRNVILVAARVGNTRLIDNATIGA